MKYLLVFLVLFIFYIICKISAIALGIHCYFTGTLVVIIGACITNTLFVVLDI